MRLMSQTSRPGFRDARWLLIGVMLLSLLGQLFLDSRRFADESACETLYRLTGMAIAQCCDPYGDAGGGSRGVSGGPDIMTMGDMPMVRAASSCDAPHHRGHSCGTCPLCFLLHVTALMPVGFTPVLVVALGWIVTSPRSQQARGPPSRHPIIHQPRGPPSRHGYAMPADFARAWN